MPERSISSAIIEVSVIGASPSLIIEQYVFSSICAKSAQNREPNMDHLVLGSRFLVLSLSHQHDLVDLQAEATAEKLGRAAAHDHTREEDLEIVHHRGD